MMNLSLKLIVVMLFTGVLLASCDIAKDTADTSKGGAKGATGIAGKMKHGTAGDADPETGEEPSEEAAGLGTRLSMQSA